MSSARDDLTEWIEVILGRRQPPSVEYPVIAFPTDQVRDEFLRNATSYPEYLVRGVLAHLLGESRDIPEWDALQLELLKRRGRQPSVEPDDESPGSSPRFTDYERRLILKASGRYDGPTFDGLGWVVDAVPHDALNALGIITSYLRVHMYVLPDLRISGLHDAKQIIRSRYLAPPHTPTERLERLHDLDPYDFEFLCAALYAKKGYQVSVTPKTKDGGVDVVASRHGTDAEKVLIACSRGRTKKSATHVSELGAAVNDFHANRGVYINLAGFTASKSGAQGRARRGSPIALVDGAHLVEELNSNLGPSWYQRLERLIAQQKKRLNAQQQISHQPSHEPGTAHLTDPAAMETSVTSPASATPTSG